MTARNNLTPEELNALNRIVVAYLELAEVHALNRQPMYMRDWLDRMDDFLRLGGRDILTHAGRISHEQAVQKVESEYKNTTAPNWPCLPKLSWISMLR